MFFAWDVDCSERKEFSMKRKKDRSNGITALYERLSRDDDNAGESNSITHQKQMLEDYAINAYVNTMFRMNNADRYEVELQVDNQLMDAIVDKFGTGVTTYEYDHNSFCMIADVSVGTAFYNWIFGFQGKVRIKGPESVRIAYEERVREAAAELIRQI